tara:strand:+ start:2496 stop:2984 length:489 start_codon:yes stop_codon:yes gene_type:complete
LTLSGTGFNIVFPAEVAQVVEHGTENAGVDSSSLSLGTFFERKWLSGRASPCQGEGREFESPLPLHSSIGQYMKFYLKIVYGLSLFFIIACSNTIYSVQQDRIEELQSEMETLQHGVQGLQHDIQRLIPSSDHNSSTPVVIEIESKIINDSDDLKDSLKTIN